MSCFVVGRKVWGEIWGETVAYDCNFGWWWWMNFEFVFKWYNEIGLIGIDYYGEDIWREDGEIIKIRE